jgi:hypothetical protein
LPVVAQPPAASPTPSATPAVPCEEARDFTRVQRPSACAVDVSTADSAAAPAAVRASGHMTGGYVMAEEQDPEDCPGRLVENYYPACSEGRMLTITPASHPGVVVRIAGDSATVTGAGCDETVSLEDGDGPLVVWDPIARACRTSAGNHPGGWAGCSQQCAAGPPTGASCLTGSHWSCCDGCYCDGRKKYDRRTHTCR